MKTIIITEKKHLAVSFWDTAVENVFAPLGDYDPIAGASAHFNGNGSITFAWDWKGKSGASHFDPRELFPS